MPPPALPTTTSETGLPPKPNKLPSAPVFINSGAGAREQNETSRARFFSSIRYAEPSNFKPEQAGTDLDCHGATPSYYACGEFYPNFSYEILTVPVQPGNILAANIEEINKIASSSSSQTSTCSVLSADGSSFSCTWQ